MSVAVELRHISKRFPGVIANKDVSMKVETGTVHALVGENGAGKSTVMKILYGMQQMKAHRLSFAGIQRILQRLVKQLLLLQIQMQFTCLTQQLESVFKLLNKKTRRIYTAGFLI